MFERILNKSRRLAEDEENGKDEKYYDQIFSA